MNRMSDDQLRAVLSRHDPAAGRTAGDARALWEQIMTTPVDERPASTVPAKPRRRLMFALAAAVVAALAGTGITIAVRAQTPPLGYTDTLEARVLELRMPDTSAGASCAIFDVARLGRMPVAFQGTAVDVADTSVELRVDRWFRGGPADYTNVSLTRPGPNVSEGVDFTAGKTYLVSAQDGEVSVCGYTGERTPELLAAYNQAFGTR